MGNLGATETLTLNVTADVVCRNPGSKRMIVEPHSYSATDTTGPIPLEPTRNGTLVVPQISGSTSASEIDAAFQCPNTNWEDEVTNVTVTGYTYTLTFNGFTQPFIVVTG